MKTVNLGDVARDAVTGIVGVVTSIQSNLTSADRIGIERQGLNDEQQPWPIEWFDEGRVTVADPARFAHLEAAAHRAQGLPGRVTEVPEGELPPVAHHSV